MAGGREGQGARKGNGVRGHRLPSLPCFVRLSVSMRKVAVEHAFLGTELCNAETNHVHFVGRVQQYVVALLWNPLETRGTLRMDRLSYHHFVDLTRQLCLQ